MALSEKGTKTAKDKIKTDKFLEKFRDDPTKFFLSTTLLIASSSA